MSTARRLLVPLAVLVLACAQVAHARTPHVTITASATWPGDTSAQTATWDLWGFIDEAGLRVLRRPAPDRIVLADPGYTWVRRGNRVVRRLGARSCAHVTVQAVLTPGPADPLVLARSLLPRATLELYDGDSDGTGPVAGAPAPVVEVSLERAVRPIRRGSRPGVLALRDFGHAGRHGYAATRVESEVLHTTGSCAPRRWSAGEATAAADEIGRATPGGSPR